MRPFPAPSALNVRTPRICMSALPFAECFGTVATITSRDNEFDEEFDTAAEVRRLSP